MLALDCPVLHRLAHNVFSDPVVTYNQPLSLGDNAVGELNPSSVGVANQPNLGTRITGEVRTSQMSIPVYQSVLVSCLCSVERGVHLRSRRNAYYDRYKATVGGSQTEPSGEGQGDC